MGRGQWGGDSGAGSGAWRAEERMPPRTARGVRTMPASATGVVDLAELGNQRLYSTSLQAYAAEEQTTSTSPVVASGDASSEPFCFLEKMTLRWANRVIVQSIATMQSCNQSINHAIEVVLLLGEDDAVEKREGRCHHPDAVAIVHAIRQSCNRSRRSGTHPSTPHIASTTAADLAHESCSPRSGIEKR